MNNDTESNAKHEHNYHLHITIKGISYAAIIGVLGYLGIGGSDITADSTQSNVGNPQYITTDSREWLSLQQDIKNIRLELSPIVTMLAKDNRKIIETNVTEK